MVLQQESTSSVCSQGVHGSRGRGRRAGTQPCSPSVQTAPLRRAQDLSVPIPHPLICFQLFFTCTMCFHVVPSCLKAVGNGLQVFWVHRYHCFSQSGGTDLFQWHWFVLVAFPTSRDGPSALQAKGGNQCSEGVGIHCSRMLKMYMLAFGVTLALPLSVWVGMRALDSACSVAWGSEGAQEAEGTSPLWCGVTRWSWVANSD